MAIIEVAEVRVFLEEKILAEVVKTLVLCEGKGLVVNEVVKRDGLLKVTYKRVTVDIVNVNEKIKSKIEENKIKR